MTEYHIPVLLQPVLEYLTIQPGKKYIDATGGGGGHTAGIVERGGTVLVIDQDQDAIRELEQRFDNEKRVVIRRGNFEHIKSIANQEGFGIVDGVLFDLGVSSFQIDKSGRGFSLRRNEPLDMRMGTDGKTAAEVINTYSAEQLTEILYRYGEEVQAPRIAREIVMTRSDKRIETSSQLAEVVTKALGRSSGKIHPATKVFQAVRIEVNRELTVLKTGLAEGFELLQKHGRQVVISFHSLEDRVVKQFAQHLEFEKRARAVTIKPVVATTDEVESNSRARSAKMRVLERL